MTRHADDPHELLRGLEAQGIAQDVIMRRMMDHLRDMIADRQELESIARLQSMASAARTAFILEACEALIEGEQQAEVVALTRYRRPQLRVVQ